MDEAIYLDGHATTPVDPEVLAAMLPWFRERYGNPSSLLHEQGRQAAEAVEEARDSVATLLGADPEEIIFTSGATESNRLALEGALAACHTGPAAASTQPRIVTQAGEHSAVLEPCAALERQGRAAVTVLPVDSRARIDLDRMEQALAGGAALVSIMAASSEVGTLHPMARVGRLCRGEGALLHCDAAQAAGRIPVDVTAWGADLLSMSGHKMHGPKGIGALYVRGGRQGGLLAPAREGSGQEQGLRPGTVNVPAVVGLGRAARLARERMVEDVRRVGRLRDRLQETLVAALPGTRVNGDPDARLPYNLHLTLRGIDAEALAYAVPGVALSTGSACASADGRPSHVLAAMGMSPREAKCSLRIGLTRETTSQEVDLAAARIIAAARRLRDLSPLEMD